MSKRLPLQRSFPRPRTTCASVRFAWRPISLAVCLLGIAPAAWALPEGAVPSFGSSAVQQTGTQLNINQTSARAGIDWTGFSIAANERVVVNQPSSSSVLLNRVLGNDPSLILGSLRANGSVWLINPRGIVFGAHSRVDVGSLLASTLPVAQLDGATGHWMFSRGNADVGALRSEGQINATNGSVVLMAPDLTQSGDINARRVGLAAATSVAVDVEGDGLIFFNARNDGSLATRLQQLGSVRADGGTVQLRAAGRAGFADTVLNLEGVVQAHSLGLRDGRIVIDGGDQGLTQVAGVVDASGMGPGERGGNIVVLGQHIALTGNARLDASGSAGGGSIRVGGDYQGANALLPNASQLLVQPNVKLLANAQDGGQGGRVILWSDQATRFGGSISARGGSAGGDGGFVEVSGRQWLDFRGQVDVSSRLGAPGRLLLDPLAINVVEAGPDLDGLARGLDLTTPVLAFDTLPLVASVITSAAINAQLGAAVTLEAKTTITVQNTATPIAGTGALTLRAGGDINILGQINAAGGITLSANDPSPGATPSGSGKVVLADTGVLDAGTTQAVLISGLGEHQIGGRVSAGSLSVSGDIRLSGTAQFNLANGMSTLAGKISGSGSLTKLGAAGLTLSGNSPNWHGDIAVNAGSLVATSNLSLGSAVGSTTVANGAALLLSDGVTLAEAITLNGNGPANDGALRNAGGSNAVTGLVTLASNARIQSDVGTLTLGQTGTDALVGIGQNLVIGGAGDTRLAGAIATGTGSLTKQGSGTLTLADTNRFTGATLVKAGVLATAGNQRIDERSALSIDSGATLQLGGAQRLHSLTGDGGLALGSSSLALGADDSSSLFGGTITGSNASTLTKAGNGVLTLGGASPAWDGTLTIAAGVLRPTHSAALGSTVGGIVVQDGAALELPAGINLTHSLTLNGSGFLGAGALRHLGGNNLVTGVVTLASSARIQSDAGTLTLGMAGDDIVLGSGQSLAIGGAGETRVAGAIATGPGSLSKDGGGLLTLTGPNRYTGSTLVQAGRLTTAGAQRLDERSALTLASGATWQLGGDQRLASLAGAGHLLLGSNSLLLGLDGSNTVFRGLITGDASSMLTKAGAGAFTLSGANTGWNGSLRVEAGVLRASHSAALGSTVGGNTVQSGAVLELSGGIRLADALTLNGGMLRSVDDNNQYTGQVTLASASTIQSDAGTLTLGMAGGDAVVGADLSLSFGGAGSTQVLGAIATGTGALIKQGSGTLTLADNNRYTGPTLVNAGLLITQGNQRIDDRSEVTVPAGATLQLSGAQSFATLNGQGLLDMGSFSLVVGLDGSSSLFGGTITGSSTSSLTKAGTGMFTLAGASPNWDGAIAVTGGVLRASHSDALGSTVGATTVASGAALELANNISLAEPVRLAGTGVNGGGALRNVSGDNSLTGLVSLAAATRIQSDAGLMSLARPGMALNGPGLPVVFGGAGNILLAGSVDIGSANLSKEGSGRLTLAGDNRYTGDTLVNAGTLLLPVAERLLDTSAVSVAAGATLSLAAAETVRNLSLAGTLDGAGTLTAANVGLIGGTVSAGLGAGALVSSGSSLLNGAAATNSLHVNGGVLTLGPLLSLTAKPTVAVDAGARLVLQSNQTTGALTGTGQVALNAATLSTQIDSATLFAGALEGSGGLSKLGSSSLTLSGANRHGGPTQVQAGTLALTGDNRLGNTTAVTVLPGASLQLGGNNTVASLTLQGSLSGSGTLTAANYLLDGGSTLASAQLGTGMLRSSGMSALGGTAAAGTVDLLDGRLALLTPERLATGSALTVASGATLTLSGDQTLGSLLLRGTLAGVGSLQAASYALDGGTSLVNLGTGLLTSTGNSLLSGRSAAGQLSVSAGQLRLASAGRLSAMPLATVASGASLNLGGDEILGSLAGAGGVALNAFTLSTGGAGSSAFAGAMSGTGHLVKLGAASNFTLTGANTYTGSTTVAQGILTVGDGGTGGGLATSQFTISGVLRSARADAVLFAQPMAGSGSLEQAGSGRLTLQGDNKRHTGTTVVMSGELATSGPSSLSPVSDLRVDTGALLTVTANDMARTIVADGRVDIATRLSASGAMLFKGAVIATGGAPIALSASQIDAVNAGNRWGSSLSIDTPGVLMLSAGSDGASLRDLTLNTVRVGAGGQIKAGSVTLQGLLSLTGGTLVIDANNAALFQLPEAALAGKRTPADRQIALAADVVTQLGTSRIDVGHGGLLSIVASQGGSVNLQSDGNQFRAAVGEGGTGGLAVRSGDANSPWAAKLATDPNGGAALQYSLQSRVRVAGQTVTMGGSGIEADVVAIRAEQLAAPATAPIVARLPYDDLVGTAQSMPGLSFELRPNAFQSIGSFGQKGAEVNINVGALAFGDRSSNPVDGGFITVVPKGGAKDTMFVYLGGPKVSNSYRFFYDGAGQLSEVPVFYNGVSAMTPQALGSIASTVSVSESARRERFDETLRTENVAPRLRAGVIAEVGPGTPATTSPGSLDPMRPTACTPQGSTLGCAGKP